MDEPHSIHAGEEKPLAPRRRFAEVDDMDITPMIDVVFLLLIFFMVAGTLDQAAAVDLPPARHGVGVSERSSVIITVAGGGAGVPAEVFIGGDKAGERLAADLSQQEQSIREAVEQGLLEGRSSVLIKAERTTPFGDTMRVATAAAAVDGAQLNVAVLEED